MIRHLGSLPELQECGTLGIPETIPARELSKLFATADAMQFSHLRRLTLEAHCEVVKTVIQSLQRPLEYLDLRIADSSRLIPMSEIASLMTLFRHHTFTTTLKSFLFSGPPLVEEDCEAFELFAPLLALKVLEHVQINNRYMTRLQDEDLAAAAAAWPYLRELVFIAYVDSPTLTLAGLIPLVKQCPRLSRLGLPIRAIPFDLSILEPGMSSPLSFLGLQCSTVAAADAEDVARCLIQLFPQLSSLLCVQHANNPTARNWDMVADFVEKLLGRWISY
ncbi:hypothetical protein H0H81_012390 [Sphagnurus paluster]|uniref:Uncharacterized protein n=1 Tax=Sphagnurus paluster TaxID=117069 RepID=A0A9P7FQG3_9AGAR|nr:hypothetical protein H0H81_012390 [Sphagnurus paluster]